VYIPKLLYLRGSKNKNAGEVLVLRRHGEYSSENRQYFLRFNSSNCLKSSFAIVWRLYRLQKTKFLIHIGEK